MNYEILKIYGFAFFYLFYWPVFVLIIINQEIMLILIKFIF